MSSNSFFVVESYYFVFAFVFTQRPEQWQVLLHLSKPVSRLLPGPHSLRVQTSSAELNRTGSSCLPHEGQDPSPALYGHSSPSACPLGPTSLQSPPLGSPAHQFITSLHFCSLDLKNEYIFFSTYSEQEWSQHPLSNAYLKHLCSQRAYGNQRFIHEKSCDSTQLARETASPSSNKQASASPQGWVPAKLMPCGWLLSTVTEGLLCARYCPGCFKSIRSHLTLLPAPWGRYDYSY